MGCWAQIGLVSFAQKKIVAALLPDPSGQFALAVQRIGSDELAIAETQPPRTKAPMAAGNPDGGVEVFLSHRANGHHAPR
ncbi:MAG TPA: hypothetical protein PK751_02555, partial [Verrucomicrobiota bacterium]|nr:hypothetical protein [Verrucomicrobiota bacterium]HQB72005.1 hypothetical protein [Verrucomicrobiota bacterium]